MGCFIGCFRGKDSKPDLVTPTPTARSEVLKAARSKNALSTLFQCDEDELLRKVGQAQNQLTGELNVKELKEEAEFVTACGNLPKRHVKTRKASEVSEGNSHSLVDSPSSCITDGQNTRRDIQKFSETSEISSQVIAPSAQCKSKSVHFDCESESSAFSSKPEYESQHLQQSGSEGNRTVTKPSPDPPPLKLTNETQTPGTVFPAHTTQMADNKIEESLMLDYEEDEMSKKQFSAGKDRVNEGSLSDWLKPVSPKVNRVRRKTPGDRPILGMVAAHWKDEETSHVLPTWWDGNGIPNSTNKYKEDQKVSWHATPFEERLEKALSEETFVSQRKSINQTPPLLGFSESEESDTAFSRLQPSDHIKSVVSF